MKKIMLLCVLYLISSSFVFATVTITSLGAQKEFKFSVDKIKEVRTSNGIKLELEGVDNYQGIHYKIGEPEIPVIRFDVSADSEKDIKIEFNAQHTKVKSIDENLRASQDSLVKLPNSKIENKFNKEIYNENRFYPNYNYSITSIGSFKGKKNFQVTLYPIKFNPVTKELAVNNIFTVSVKNYMLAQVEKLPTFLFLVGKKFENSASLKQYMKLKQELGFNVISKVIGATDAPDVIRKKIQEVYRQPNLDLQYTIIVGRNEDVPAYESDTITGVTDHYYRSIDTNDYDSDINSPDQGVGRLTVKNEAELNTVLTKFTKYQKGDLNPSNWKNRAAFLATDDRYQVAEGTHNYVINTYTKLRSYSGTFPDRTTLGGDKLYAITYKADEKDVIGSFNLGNAIINYSGHGAPSYWAGPRFTQDDVRNMKFLGAYPFVISNACVTGEFTSGESFGETWLKSPNGAIMFWGSMDNTYWTEDDILERRMFDGIYKLNKESFKDITEFAMKEFWKYFGGEGKSKYYWETYVTFGDPSIKLRKG